MTEHASPLIPEWEEMGIEVSDAAEPEDAEITHEASVEEVEEFMEEDN